jgi:maltooligosyltrehalose trehalohydrolase
LRGKQEAYFHDYAGAPQEFVSSIKYGYLFQGQWYDWQRHGRGTPVLGFEPGHFINFIQNHDQIANSGLGRRIHALSHPGDCRAFTALLLLGPQIPLLFQGQEYGTSSPFLFFADHEPELASKVSSGRRDFLHQFPSLAATDTQPYLNEPHDESAFYRCKLDDQERRTNLQAYSLHKDLLHMRRSEPAFAESRLHPIDGAVLSDRAFMIRFFGAQPEDTRVLMVNYGNDLKLVPMPEPLLAPPEHFRWQLAWSTDHPGYGGGGVAPFDLEADAALPAHSAVVLKVTPLKKGHAHGTQNR